VQRHGGTGKSIDGEVTEPAAMERGSGSTSIVGGRRRTVMPPRERLRNFAAGDTVQQLVSQADGRAGRASGEIPLAAPQQVAAPGNQPPPLEDRSSSEPSQQRWTEIREQDSAHGPLPG
jgi:hypothetical protein